MERGKGVGARRVGEGGRGKGGGVRGGVRGVESIFKWSFQQNSYRNFRLGYRNAHYETKSAEIAFFWGGIPNFWGNPPCNDITFSKIHHNLARKVRKRDVREISPNYLCKMEQPSWKSEKLAHFEFLNSNISVFGHDFKPKMKIWTDFSVIWRWYKRLETTFSSFWVKIGGWCGSSAHGSKISNWHYDGMALNFH